MASEITPDDGSCEHLLDKEEEEEEEEEDCVKLLLDSLEKDGGDISENWTERKKTLQESGKHSAESDVSLYLKKKYGTHLGDKLDGSVNGSVSDINASLIKLNANEKTSPTNSSGHGSGKNVVPASVLQRQKLAMKLLKKHNSEKGKVVCGIVVMLLILGLGGGLIFLAFLLDMEDLYILGGIFTLGGIAFTIAFIVVRCLARQQLEGTDYSVLYKP